MIVISEPSHVFCDFYCDLIYQATISHFNQIAAAVIAQLIKNAAIVLKKMDDLPYRIIGIIDVISHIAI